MATELVPLKVLFDNATKKYGRLSVSSKKETNGTKINGKTGLFRVIKVTCVSCKQGFMYQYTAYENKKQTRFTSTKILDLKRKVLDEGFEWRVIDNHYAHEIAKENEIPFLKII